MSDCNRCIWATRNGGCASWDCDFVLKDDAYKAWKESTQDNQPLIWDELLEMKGKPVWLDMDKPKWIVILNVGTMQDGTRIFCDENDFYDMKDYGIKWMPYRLERKQ
jgi:hypothetical protein